MASGFESERSLAARREQRRREREALLAQVGCLARIGPDQPSAGARLVPSRVEARCWGSLDLGRVGELLRAALAAASYSAPPAVARGGSRPGESPEGSGAAVPAVAESNQELSFE